MIKQIKILIIFFYFLTIEVGALENKIILKINNNIITSLDIYDEVNYLKYFNKKLSGVNDDEIYQIAFQSLTRSEIKKIEVKKNFNDINLLNTNYLNDIIEKTFKSFNIDNLSDFKNDLANNNLDYKKYEEKLKIDILWNQIIFDKYSNKISINEKELREKISKQKTRTKYFNLSEIVFQISKSNDLDNTYSLIKKDIENIGFENAAIKYSISKTSDNGGKLGWVEETLLDKKLTEKLEMMSTNTITNPIKVSSGFLILKKTISKKKKK